MAAFGRLRPATNITPFTYRDGTTMLEMVYLLKDYIENVLIGGVEEHTADLIAEINGILDNLDKEINETLANIRSEFEEERELGAERYARFTETITAIVAVINNKSGAVDIQRVTLTAPYTLKIDVSWPDNQPVSLVLTQDSFGGRPVDLGEGIEGALVVSTGPNAETSLTLIPQGDGTWKVFQVESVIESRVKVAERSAAKRLLVGARVTPPDGTDMLPGADYFNATHTLESEMSAKFDIINWYCAVGAGTVDRFKSEIVPELVRSPQREVMYALEIHRTNDNFISEFNNKTGIYVYLRDLFEAIIESGYADRIKLAPFHEGNGGGGTYPWQMFDTTNGNNIEKSKECFRLVVGMARNMGLSSRFIQWFLSSNSSSSGDDTRDITKCYVGDEWADIIGVSYYNRAVDGSSETAVGGTLIRFMRHVENMSGRNVWICESGCYPSLPTHDKGVWYSDLIRLGASTELPRLEAICLFMASGTGGPTGKALENREQKRRVGRAINDSRRIGSYGNPADLTRNLIPRPIAVPSKASDWTLFATPGLPALKATITDNVPDNVDAINTSLRITKPYSEGISTDYRVYRSVKTGDVDFQTNRVHTTGFWARASYDGFKLGFGVRQTGGNNIAGDSRIELSTQWEYYNTPFATGMETGETWSLPHMTLGDNSAAGWFEITDMQITRGTHPTPDVSKVTVPRIKHATDAPVITVNCESVDTHIITLTGNRLLAPPSGAAYDGQTLTIRVRQDSIGGRTLALNDDSRWFTSSVTLGAALTSVPFTQAMVTMVYFSDQDKWGITNTVKMNFQ